MRHVNDDLDPAAIGHAGRTAFSRLRQQVQRDLGDRFDLGRYHEAVLSHGTLPVKYLPELLRDDFRDEGGGRGDD
jgi:uncharacterized protein (DUF885 family)